VPRKLAVLAWLTATLVSVGVSTAAVESVRVQVTQRPTYLRLVDLTAAAAATTTTTVETTTTIAPTSTTTGETTTASPPETTTTSADPTTTEPEPEPQPTRPEPDTTEAAPETQVEERTVAGGTVVVEFDGEELRLVDVEPADGYEAVIDTDRPGRIAVRFVDGRRTSAVQAVVVDGRLEVRTNEDDRTRPNDQHQPPDDD
jgi:cytoskeletal protein RodZ